ncbi:hypothetical protein [Streptacidiphilus jiangxiensis]|uniref:hypothetical protein n=1 Tax=Streptacidiphilus jiangxiensis TaxID=235985 RepID=UPI00313FF43E
MSTASPVQLPVFVVPEVPELALADGVLPPFDEPDEPDEVEPDEPEPDEVEVDEEPESAAALPPELLLVSLPELMTGAWDEADAVPCGLSDSSRTTPAAVAVVVTMARRMAGLRGSRDGIRS